MVYYWVTFNVYKMDQNSTLSATIDNNMNDPVISSLKLNDSSSSLNIESKIETTENNEVITLRNLHQKPVSNPEDSIVTTNPSDNVYSDGHHVGELEIRSNIQGPSVTSTFISQTSNRDCVSQSLDLQATVADSSGVGECASKQSDHECAQDSVVGDFVDQSIIELSYATVQQNPADCNLSDATQPVYKFKNEDDIELITGAWSEFQTTQTECFTKGCKWAPDGTCILTNSDDNTLRIFDLPKELHCQESWTKGHMLPEMEPALRIPEGGIVYDYCWYPLMSSWDPLSCCLVSSSQDSPTHLWDAYSGELRCTYRAYNSVDEVEHAYSVAFDLMGDKLYCGFKDIVRVFNTNRPGRDCDTRSLKGVGRPVGIVSCVCVNPASQKLYAVSSYLKSLALCAEPNGEVVCLLCGVSGTHLAFSPDGSKLYVGGRNDPEIFCWDMRNLGTVLYTLQRHVTTNQRVYFDLSPDGRHVMSGNTNGEVTIWDTLEPPDTSSNNPVLPKFLSYQAHKDCVNGISNHRQYPILATSSGQRHFPEPSHEDNSDDDNTSDITTVSSPLLKRKYIQREDSLKLWWLGHL